MRNVCSLAVFCLRPDYGPSWNGDLIIKNVSLYYNVDYKAANPTNELMLLQTYTPDLRCDFDSVKTASGNYETDGKCTIYLPKNVVIEGVSAYRYTYTGYDKATDTLTGFTLYTNESAKVYLYNPFVYGQGSTDISKYGALDGQKTVIASTQTITVSNCTSNIILPRTAQFKNTDCTVNGESVVLWEN